MRFKIVGVEGDCVDCLCVDYDAHNPDYGALLNYEGGEVVTADEVTILEEQNTALQARVCELEQEVIRLANLKNRLLGEVIREDKTFTNA